MSEARAPIRSGWTRWAPGSAVLLYFVLSAGLWLGSLLSWQVGQPELVVALLALGAFFPLVWLAVGLRRRPVWGLQIREEPARIADAVVQAVRDRHPVPVSPSDAGRGGLFRGCNPVLRIDEPLCFIGIRRSPADSTTTVLLLPRSKDQEALDQLRSTIEARVVPSG